MKTKRIFAFLTALVLCLALLPVVPHAQAAFVDLQFTPYVFDPKNPGQMYSYCNLDGSSGGHGSFLDSFTFNLIGEEVLPSGVAPADVAVTKLQWSPGTVFVTANAHDFPLSLSEYSFKWLNENARMAKLYLRNTSESVITEMETAGLHNTDPFTVRVTQTWNGGVYTFDYTYDGLISLGTTYYFEGLEEYYGPSKSITSHIDNNIFAIQQPTVKKNSDGTYDFTVSYLRKKDTSNYSHDEKGTWINFPQCFLVEAQNVFSDKAYNTRGVINRDCLTSYWVSNYSRDDSFPSENYERYTRTMTFKAGQSISAEMLMYTEYRVIGSTEGREHEQGYYYHDLAWTFNYTFGGSSGEDEVPASHTLTINYVLADGAVMPAGVTLPETYTEQIMEGVTYNIPSPDMSAYGLAPDIAAVTGTMGKEDQTVTVTYGTAHKLTVNYELGEGVSLPAGRSLPDACVMLVPEGGAYTVVTPKLADLTPDKDSVTGTMGTEDVSATVTYYARVSVTGEENGDELTYTVRYCPVNALLLAARYGANGRMTYARTVTVPAGYSQGTLIMGSAGEKYKLMLVDRTTYAPLCRAWESEPDA